MGLSIWACNWHFRLISFLQPSLLPSSPWTDKTPEAATWLSIILHWWGPSFPLLWLLSLPPSPASYHVIFDYLYQVCRRCSFFPCPVTAVTSPSGAQTLHFSHPLTGLLAFLQTVPLFFELSLSPLVKFSLKGHPKCHHFLHESSVICPARFGLFFWNHVTKIYLNLCPWRRYIPDIYIMSSVLHTNLSNVINFPIPTWITYAHLKLTCPKRILDFST